MDTWQSFSADSLYDRQQLSFSETSIQFCLEAGALTEGSFLIHAEKGKKVRGRVYSTHWRMQCKNDSRFQGTDCEMQYLFDSTGMENGDTVKGQFLIVSDLGEYRISFAVTVQPHYLTTPEGRLKSLDSFVHLAQLDMDAAYQAYVHPQFVNTLRAEEETLQHWYDGLNKNGRTYGSMLEFLRLIGHPVEEPQDEPLKTELRKLYAQRSGNTEKQERKRESVQLLRLYLKFRSGQLPPGEWTGQSKELLTNLRAKGSYKDFYALGMVHMLLVEKKDVLAKEQLDTFANTHYDLQKNAELYGYYLYLCVLQRRSAAFLEQACAHVRKLFEKHSGSALLLWVLLMIDGDLLHDGPERIRRMKALYEMGVTTPLLLIEAVMLCRQNPKLIETLSAYEVHVLAFARRYHLLNHDMTDRMISLALGGREYSAAVYALLQQCYQESPQPRCLQAICTLLIKGHKIGKDYFTWYRRGVEEGLRIASLHDYYMHSMDETMERPIHESVLRYFQYNQELDYRKKSYLFANLMFYKEQYAELYESYYNDMVEFVVHQLDKGRVNPHLRYLYSELVNKQYIGQKNAYHIADFVFSFLIEEIPETVTAVIVRDPSLAEERSIPVREGEAVVPVYSEEACMFYQEADGSRKCVTDRTHFSRWFEKETLLPVCERYCPSHPGLLLRKCEQLVSGKEQSWQMALAQITADTQMSYAFRMQLWQNMLDLFYDSYNRDAIAWCLSHIRVKELLPEYRNHNIMLLLLNGSYEEALAYIATYGCEHIPEKMLVPMCSRMVCQKEFLYDESCLTVCREVFFRGKYDEIMLEYLIEYMDGGTQELEQLWRAGMSFGLDTYPVTKKLVARILHTKCLPVSVYDIFEDYYRNCGRDNLVSAFLTYFAKEAIGRQMQIDRRIYEWIRKEIVRGESVNETCRICWLYGISQDAALAGGETALAADILQELLLEERYFAFYGQLPAEVTKGQLFGQSTFFEYRTDPVHHVTLYYRIKGERTGFTEEELEQSFPGVFVKELLLFGDELLQYYVVEQSAQKTWIAASGELTAACREKRAGRFGSMEQLLERAQTAQAEELLETYLTQSYVTEQMFYGLD